MKRTYGYLVVKENINYSISSAIEFFKFRNKAESLAASLNYEECKKEFLRRHRKKIENRLHKELLKFPKFKIVNYQSFPKIYTDGKKEFTRWQWIRDVQEPLKAEIEKMVEAELMEFKKTKFTVPTRYIDIYRYKVVGVLYDDKPLVK